MAPEVIDAQTGAAYDGLQADSWPVGAVLFVMTAGWPPYSVPDGRRDKFFRRLRDGAFATFWGYHRECGFAPSPLLQDLLTRLLQINPRNRLSIADAAQHPWLQGEKLSPQALQEVMAARKERMRNPQVMLDAAQQAQPRVQPQPLVSEQADDMHSASSPSHQHLDAGSAVTHCPPLLASALGVVPLSRAAAMPRRLVPAASTQRSWQEERKEAAAPVAANVLRTQPVALQGRATPLSSAQLATAVDADSTAAADASLPVYDPELTLPTATTLFSRLPAAELTKRLIELLRLNHIDTTCDDKQRSITGSISTPSGLSCLRLQLWREKGEEENGSIRIEFRRLQGDSAQYRQIFADLLLQMDGIVVY